MTRSTIQERQEARNEGRYSRKSLILVHLVYGSCKPSRKVGDASRYLDIIADVDDDEEDDEEDEEYGKGTTQCFTG